jgi:hypothetical protein
LDIYYCRKPYDGKLSCTVWERGYKLALVHPFIVAGQIATAYYFAHFLVILPILGSIDNLISNVGVTYYGTFKRGETFPELYPDLTPEEREAL